MTVFESEVNYKHEIVLLAFYSLFFPLNLTTDFVM